MQTPMRRCATLDYPPDAPTGHPRAPAIKGRTPCHLPDQTAPDFPYGLRYPLRTAWRNRRIVAGQTRPCGTRLARLGRRVRPELDVDRARRSGHQIALPRLGTRSVLADDQH